MQGEQTRTLRAELKEKTHRTNGLKTVIIGSLLFTVPFLNLVLLPAGMLTLLWVALAGATLMASFSVTMVSAQEIFPDNKAVALNPSLGFGLELSDLGVGGVGYITPVAPGSIKRCKC
jgi:FSR family fosmidomycin resistance protein-like MFS transporter